MLRRRLFVLGACAFVAAGVVAVGAEPPGRQFFAARRARIGCADDPGGVIGAPCRRSLDASAVELVTPQATTEKFETKDGEILQTEEEEEQEEDPSGENIGDPTAIEEARGKKKRGRLLKVFFMMAAAAKATLLYAMIHAVALVAGKALVVAKVALALAAAVALKKALGEHHDKTSYEIVKHPHHSYVQTHSASVDYDHHGGTGSGGYEGGHRRRRRFVR